MLCLIEEGRVLGHETEKVNEYILDEPFQAKDAGTSRWTFAKKNGQAYFIKEFINPVFPVNPEVLSPGLIKEKVDECRAFENRQRYIYSRISDLSDGHLVRILDFFRRDSHYYITTEKVDSSNISLSEISELPFDVKICLCRGLAHGLMLLHSAKIVHADIKATNVLIKKLPNGRLSGKIIDFDCAFFEKQKIGEEELGGDFVYLSPEACRFMFGEEVDLTCKMDVFSLGLLFHQYLSGTMPEFDKDEYDYAHVALLEGQKLKLSDKIPLRCRELIEHMLVVDPKERYDMLQVFNELGELLDQGDELREETDSEKTTVLSTRFLEAIYTPGTEQPKPQMSQKLYIDAALMKGLERNETANRMKVPATGTLSIQFSGEPVHTRVITPNTWRSVGRSVESDIVVPAKLRAVSRNHIKVLYDNYEMVYFVIDSSENGTFLSNSRRLPKDKSVRIESGTQLELGDSNCTILLK